MRKNPRINKKLLKQNLLKEMKKGIELNKAIQSELTDKLQHVQNILDKIDVSVDVHQDIRYSRSWAVVSIQGVKTDYLKFMDLGNSDVLEIQKFLRKFEKVRGIKIDAAPGASQFLRIDKRRGDIW